MIAIMQSGFPDRLSAMRSTTRHLAGGAVLFQRNDRVDRIFRVISGEVRLVRWQKDGTTAVLQRARPGDLLAEASLLSDRYHCGGEAVGETLVRVWQKKDVTNLIRRDQDAALAFSHYLAREVRRARLRAETLALRRLGDRLDAWLAWNDGALPERGVWRQLAEDLNVTPEALYRELARRRAA